MKRGQVTFFAIAGIVILLIAGSLVYLQVQKRREQQPIAPTLALPPYAQQVYLYVQSCIDDILPLGVFLLGRQSGFYRPLTGSLRTNETTLAYYYRNGVSHVPTARDVENQLSQFIKENLPLCIDFSRFPSLTITQKVVSPSVTLRDEDVYTQVAYPLMIKKDESSITINKPYTSTLSLRLTKILAAASQITEAAQKDPETIDLTLLLETDFDVNIIQYDDHTIIYAITDKQSTIHDIPYTFLFAHEL